VKCSYVGCNEQASVVILQDKRQIALCDNHFRELEDLLIKIAIVKGKIHLNELDFKRRRNKILIESSFNVKEKDLRKRMKSIKKYLGIIPRFQGKIKARRRSSPSKKSNERVLKEH